jgi:NADH dehydrogenase
MKVFLTGGTGFVGSHLVARLLADGHSVRALVRGGGMLRAPEAPAGRLEVVKGDIRSNNLSDCVRGFDAVINLVGIIYERGGASFEKIHHLGTRNLVQAARKDGVKRFVQMSALGARPANASAYHTTKFAAEEEVRKSGIPFVVLRPSVIVGPGSAFIKQMVEVMRKAPLIRPVPGTGKYEFRPVHVDDVVECFAQSLTSADSTGQTVGLVGGEELSLDEISDAIAECLHIRKAIVHVPIPIMRAAAALFSLLPGTPPVTSVQLRMMEEGSTADPAAMKRIFHIKPEAFRVGLSKYLEPSSL